MARSLRLLGVGVVIAGEQAPSIATELELDNEPTVLDVELLELDSELIEADLELLDAEPLEFANWLLAALLARLELLADDRALELENTKIGSELLETPADELMRLAIDEDSSLACVLVELAATEVADLLPTELAATTPELTELAATELEANGLAGELSEPVPPAPPPQDAKKLTDNNNVLILNCLNDAIVIND